MYARVIAAFAGIVLAVASGTTPAVAAPLDTYGRLPTLEDVAVSPDGAHIAYVTVVAEERAVVVFDVAAGKALGALKVSTQKLRNLTWADDQHLLITISKTTNILELMAARQEWFMTLSYDINSHQMRNLMDGVADSMNVVRGAPQPRIVDGHTIVYLEGIYFESHRGHLALFAVDLANRRVKPVEKRSDTARGWVIDARGNVVAETDYDESKQHWGLRLKKSGRWSEVLGRDTAINMPVVEGLSADGNSIVISETDGSGVSWRALSLTDSAKLDPLGREYNVSRVLVDPASHLIIGGQADTASTHYVFFDQKDEATWEKIALALDGENVELISWSNDRNVIALRVSGERTGISYVLLDLRSRKLLRIGSEYEGIGPADVAPVQTLTYAAADGLKIPAYLTLPKGKAAKNLPLVVLVHGGPAVRDKPGFDWWSQALASRGYAVLQPEYRGSNGISPEHLSAGFGEWGRKMQSDVSDGVRDLAKRGVIDPARVCIVGASYGGYAALAGVTLESGVYRCAVSVAGVSDPRAMLKWTQSREWRETSTTLRYWDRFMGVTGPNDARLDEISPLAHAARASGPILLIHGQDDTVVAPEQSDMMLKALQRANKPAQFVKLSGEDHWLSRSDTRLLMLQETVKFLEANNPP